MKTTPPKLITVPAPRDYFLGPVFAATRQTEGREIVIGDRRYLIGGFHPLRRDNPRHNIPSPPALDVRHARAVLALLSFRTPFEQDRLIKFSFNELCHRYARSNGGRYARDLANVIGDLLDSFIRITDLRNGYAHEYRMIERIHIEKRPARGNPEQLETWFHSVTLSPEFSELLAKIADLQHIKLPVFTSIRSPLAQSIYLFLPSRAHHHTEADPFETTLTTLLTQVAHPIPTYKSDRRGLFTQNKNSIISQLDGKETLSGVFRVRLAETADGADWKLQCWVEPTPRQLPKAFPDSKMIAAWLAAGNSREELARRLATIAPLDCRDLELLALAQVRLPGCEPALKLAKALLGGTRFEGLLAEAKGDALEGRPTTKTPNHRLMSRIMEAVSASCAERADASGT